MNFYSFHIGDYASATRHLTWMEDAAYRRLLDVYYVKEGPLPADLRQVYRLAVASTPEQRDAIDIVLQEFFVLTDAGYTHMRCEQEIACAAEKKNKAAQSARARWGNAKGQDVAMPSQEAAHNECNANASSEACERIEKACVSHAPNPNPNPNPKEAKASNAYAPPEWVPAEPWAEFVRMRKAMRNVPFTAAAAMGVVRELEKLRRDGHAPDEMLLLAVTNGWRTVYPPKQGLQVRGAGGGNTGETAYQRSMRERIEEVAPDIARRAPAPRQDAADFFRTVDAVARVVPTTAIEVTR